MKELITILRSNKHILFWTLCFFVIAEVGIIKNFFFFASFVLLLIAFSANISLLNFITGRVMLIIIMFATFWLFSVNPFPFSSFLIWSSISCVLFMLGRSLIKKNNDDDLYYIGLLIIVALFTGIYNIAISIGDMIEHGIVNLQVITDRKDLYDETWRPTSLLAAELAPLISCIVLFFVISDNNKTNKIARFGGFLSIIGLICTMHFVSRSAFIVAVACLTIGIFYSHKRHTIRMLLLLAILVVLFLNTGFGELFEYKNNATDTATGNGRIERVSYWLNLVLQHPYGVPNYKNHWVPWAHNFWIDFAKEGGWIPGICLVIFSLLNVKDIVLVLKNKNMLANIKLLVFSMGLAFLLAFSVEPIFGGADYGMFAYFFFCGLVSSLTNTPIAVP